MKTIKYTYYLSVALLGLMLTGVTSCVGDLDTLPLDKDELVSENVFGNTEDAYIQSLAKIYAGMAIGGNAGGDGDQDVAGIDGGSQASFLRAMWNMQELPTDEAHCAWSDPGIPGFNEVTWSAGSPWIKGNYYRYYYQINLSNAFLRETVEEKLDSRGCSAELKAKIKVQRAEARFLRALSYTYLLDFYRNVPLVTEESPIGETQLPVQVSPKELFTFIEKELNECQTDMLDPFIGYDAANYGRAHKAAAWSLLARLYLNAEVFIGENKYTECITACKLVIGAGYELEPIYVDMFKADNDHSREMIFPIRYEGDQTMTWGGMTALLCWGSAEAKEETNAKDAWQGVRAKSSLLSVFERENSSSLDSRKAMLRTEWTTNNEIVNQTEFKNNGIPVVKYYNVNKDGSLPPSVEAYTDFPLFRLAEIYLTYAEAVLRGGAGGDRATALNYVNTLRKRAYDDESAATIGDPSFTLDFLIDEWGREFFFEARRRTDLIRFNQFTGGSYIWPWKGGVANGTSVGDHLKIFPLPADEIGSNTNLVQNPQYQ